jgi:serine/threonine protein kinase
VCVFWCVIRRVLSFRFHHYYYCHLAHTPLPTRKLSREDDEAQLREVEILRYLNPKGFDNSLADDGGNKNKNNINNNNNNGIINLIDFFPTPTSYRIVMELARGGDVFDRLAKRRTYTEKTARDFALSLFHAVEYLHDRNVAHRDIKPENLLLMEEHDDSGGVRLGDFGFARRFDSSSSSLSAKTGGGGGKDDDDDHAVETSMSTQCGTPAFVPPELVLGRRYGPKCDMWSAGCTLVRKEEMCCRCPLLSVSLYHTHPLAHTPETWPFFLSIILAPTLRFAGSLCSW